MMSENSFFLSAENQLVGQRGIGAADTVAVFDSLPCSQTVLEVGFGEGVLARALIDCDNRYYGLDVGRASTEGAIKDGFIHKGTFLWMDACYSKFPFIDDFFDYAYCTECIEHLENPYHMFLEVKRTLKPGGKFVLAFPRPEDNLGYEGGQHAHMYPGFLLKGSFRMFCQQMYFKVLSYRENGSSAWYLLENVKEGTEVGVHEMIQGNYDEEKLYGHLKGSDTWPTILDPRTSTNTLHKLGIKEVKY